ncbi:MAG: hypothetical protein IPK17_20265 [Chloroflexi bacterium]|uniref:hypothetical protein n=1 Tax=Candidatus Flexifilum breve TaxID=3140694 RepID=UPI0031363C1D|nr:hypothetical protein [Chloroflexota bacterium]
MTATVEPTAAEMPLTRTPRPTFTPVPPSRTPRPTHTATGTSGTDLTPTLTGYQNFTQGMQAFDSGATMRRPSPISRRRSRSIPATWTPTTSAGRSLLHRAVRRRAERLQPDAALKPDYLDVYANRAQVQYELGDSRCADRY